MSPGIDGIRVATLIEITEYAAALAFINETIIKGECHFAFKVAFIRYYIYKNDSKVYMLNYRSISLRIKFTNIF